MADLSDKDRVRLLISDIGGDSTTDFIFSDNEIENFLSLKGGNVFRAAAIGLRTIAVNEAFVAKRIKFLELETDGPAVAKALRELAKEYDDTADQGVDPDSVVFEVGPMASGDFYRRAVRGWLQ